MRPYTGSPTYGGAPAVTPSLFTTMAREYMSGYHAVATALQAGRPVDRLLLAKDGRVRGRDALLDEARAQGIPFDFVPLAKLNDLAGHGEHEGVVARVAPISYHTLDTWLAMCPVPAVVLVLDQVQHPKNLGMLLRTAAAAGAAGVLLPKRGGALVDDTVLRASAGTAHQVPLVTCDKAAQALRTLQAAGFWVYALDAAAPESVFTCDWPARAALVIGNEARGLRPAVRKACDTALHIPMADGVESLNAAVSAALALYAARRHQGAWS